MAAADARVTSALRRNFLFTALTDTEVQILAKDVWLEDIPGSTIVVKEGDVADALYLVVEGGVNVTKADGRFLAFLVKDGFFGEMAIFVETALRTATCQTTVDTQFAVIRRDVIDRYSQTNPIGAMKIFRAIIRTMADRLAATSADLAMLMGTKVRPQDEVSAMVEAAKRKRKNK